MFETKHSKIDQYQKTIEYQITEQSTIYTNIVENIVAVRKYKIWSGKVSNCRFWSKLALNYIKQARYN